jgi:hypothetical protein
MMKNIIISIIVFVTLIQAKPCMTDIYFGNGILGNDKKAQIISLEKLETVLNFDKATQQNINYKLSYNPGHGVYSDLFELYWQLYESGQISQGYFMAMHIAVNHYPEEFPNFKNLHEEVVSQVAQYNKDVEVIRKFYKTESFDRVQT